MKIDSFTNHDTMNVDGLARSDRAMKINVPAYPIKIDSVANHDTMNYRWRRKTR